MSSDHDHMLEENSGRTREQHVSSHNLIEPSLANIPGQEAFSVNMSQAEERILELQLQAAAAAVANDEIPSNAQQTNHDHVSRQRRLGRACDACSRRKVKCGNEVPCKSCVDLDIACTFVRPVKRRGPANKVAEELKRTRYELTEMNQIPTTLPPESTSPYSSLDSIVPFETIHRLVYDFFTYLYPIFPFPHEHLVMDNLRKRDDAQCKSFNALISSMLAAFATLFPRKVNTAIGQLGQDGQSTTVKEFISRCIILCEQSRSPLMSEENVNDAATSFFLGLVCYVERNYPRVELHLTEALAIVRFLGVERNGVLADGNTADFVTIEISRRIYWAVDIFTRHLQQSGVILDIIPPRRASQLPHPPQATDDYYIYKDCIQDKPQGQLSSLEGFNLISRIYSLQQPLVKFDLSDDQIGEISVLNGGGISIPASPHAYPLGASKNLP
ncbi:hypothetical protein, variant [Verruconis gallopava]|uniref:Zn(2)-C6 fungal-type domain-containing protein n=1 Tax=Verruconis gallopava TaxID=253628 RepID=A0A0D2AV26_9PEZI|nr:hypothetical protein, variant [Verruconis gallopava]KIW02989.1 hypothetical protein, variant [Verruconis gallopava]